MSDRGTNLHFPERTNGSPLWASAIPVLAGTAAYFVFAERLELPEAHAPWWGELLEVAPALLVGTLFQVFVLVPISLVFSRLGLHSRSLFLVISLLIWTGAAGTILLRTNAVLQGNLWVDASILVPGYVIAVAFTLVNLGPKRRPPR